MKQRMLLTVVMIMMPVIALPQARVTNSGNYKVEMRSTDGTRAVNITAGSTAFISWLPSTGNAEYFLSRYENNQKVDLGKFTGVVTNGVLTVADRQTTVTTTAQKAGVRIPAETTVSQSPLGSTANLSIVDSTSFRVTIPTGPFAGISLKSNQKSLKKVDVTLGKVVFPLLYDSEIDSLSSGLRYKWAIINKIIVEGQTELVIKNEDLQEAASETKVTKSLRNTLPFNIMITNELNEGVVIPANSTVKKLSFYSGWNFITIQYKDQNGWPTQAILVLLVSQYDRLSADQIGEENIIFTTR